MLRSLLLIVAIFCMTFAPSSSVAAKTSLDQPLNDTVSGSYVTEIFCTNVGSAATTTFQIIFYGSDSSTIIVSYSDPTPIDPGTSRSYFTPSLSPSLPSSFIGSAVVTADQPMECDVNTEINGTNVGTSTNPSRFGTSGGIDSNKVSNKLYASQVIKDYSGWNSYFAVQNTESTDITVNVSYTDRYGTAYPLAKESVVIPAQSNHVFYQNENANLPSQFMGGATISSTGKMAAVVNFFNSGADSTTSQFSSYNAIASGANKLFVPNFVRNFYGYQGGLSVQNVGQANTSVTITFSFAGNSYVYNSGTIVPGATIAMYAPDIVELTAVDLLNVYQRTGSAIIQAAAGGSIVANINIDNRGSCTTGVECGTIQTNWLGHSATYSAVVDGTQTNTIYFVQVARHVGTADFSGGYQFANTTNISTTCTISFPAAPAANQTNVSLGGYGTISVFAPNVPNLPDGYNGSVVVTCGQPILGISNISARNESYLGDSFGQTNGYNR
jgi:hypothetical protein